MAILVLVKHINQHKGRVNYFIICSNVRVAFLYTNGTHVKAIKRTSTGHY